MLLATSLKLSDDEIKKLEELYKPHPVLGIGKTCPDEADRECAVSMWSLYRASASSAADSRHVPGAVWLSLAGIGLGTANDEVPVMIGGLLDSCSNSAQVAQPRVDDSLKSPAARIMARFCLLLRVVDTGINNQRKAFAAARIGCTIQLTKMAK